MSLPSDPAGAASDRLPALQRDIPDTWGALAADLLAHPLGDPSFVLLQQLAGQSKEANLCAALAPLRRSTLADCGSYLEVQEATLQSLRQISDANGGFSLKCKFTETSLWQREAAIRLALEAPPQGSGADSPVTAGSAAGGSAPAAAGRGRGAATRAIQSMATPSAESTSGKRSETASSASSSRASKKSKTSLASLSSAGFGISTPDRALWAAFNPRSTPATTAQLNALASWPCACDAVIEFESLPRLSCLHGEWDELSSAQFKKYEAARGGQSSDAPRQDSQDPRPVASDVDDIPPVAPASSPDASTPSHGPAPGSDIFLRKYTTLCNDRNSRVRAHYRVGLCQALAYLVTVHQMGCGSVGGLVNGTKFVRFLAVADDRVVVECAADDRPYMWHHDSWWNRAVDEVQHENRRSSALLPDPPAMPDEPAVTRSSYQVPDLSGDIDSTRVVSVLDLVADATPYSQRLPHDFHTSLDTACAVYKGVFAYAAKRYESTPAAQPPAYGGLEARNDLWRTVLTLPIDDTAYDEIFYRAGGDKIHKFLGGKQMAAKKAHATRRREDRADVGGDCDHPDDDGDGGDGGGGGGDDTFHHDDPGHDIDDNDDEGSNDRGSGGAGGSGCSGAPRDAGARDPPPTDAPGDAFDDDDEDNDSDDDDADDDARGGGAGACRDANTRYRVHELDDGPRPGIVEVSDGDAGRSFIDWPKLCRFLYGVQDPDELYPSDAESSCADQDDDPLPFAALVASLLSVAIILVRPDEMDALMGLEAASPRADTLPLPRLSAAAADQYGDGTVPRRKAKSSDGSNASSYGWSSASARSATTAATFLSSGSGRKDGQDGALPPSTACYVPQ